MPQIFVNQDVAEAGDMSMNVHHRMTDGANRSSTRRIPCIPKQQGYETNSLYNLYKCQKDSMFFRSSAQLLCHLAKDDSDEGLEEDPPCYVAQGEEYEEALKYGTLCEASCNENIWHGKTGKKPSNYKYVFFIEFLWGSAGFGLMPDWF